ncbi:MAG: hypothetical protein FIB07_06075 [Candidatus Methanoperedens sp.]|nr:hypothetical protein [Candidatus Methanoperedens sp.]
MAKRIAPQYDMLFGEGKFNATLLIGPDPLGANFDFKVFLEARRRLVSIGFRLTDSKRGFVEYQKTFDYDNKKIKARIHLILGRNFSGNLQETWRESLANEDLIYLKTHAGYGKHLSLSDDVIYFTDAMKEGFDLSERKPYQLYYLDCCKSEMYYKDAFRNYIGGNGVDLILHKWFCDYMIIGPVVILIRELMAGSDFETIVLKMNEEYGIPHFDVEDDPADKRLDRKMVTYSVSD